MATSLAQPAPPRAGDLAPDFTLQSTTGEKVTLSAQRGHPVLLAFFPLAFSETCTEQFCEMRDDWSQFAARGVTVFPISIDSRYSLREYREKYSIPVEMLSDLKREASLRYGIFLPERGYANRAYFLLDREGVVRWAHVEANPSHKRSNAEILAEVDKLG